MNQEKTLERFIGHLLGALKIPYTTTYLKKYAISSPEENSLIAITDLLDLYHIPNLAVKLQPEQLPEIDLPALVQIKDGEDEDFVILQKFNNTQVTYYDLDKGIQEVGVQEFVQQWQGVTLLMAPDQNSGEPNYQENLKEEKGKQRDQWLGWGALAFTGIASVFYTTSHWVQPILILVSLVGLIASIVLLMNELGQKNTLIGKLCNINKATDCEAVTSSEQSKFLGWLSWAEIGAIYFTGFIFAVLLVASQQSFAQSLTILMLVSALTVPYTFFSVYQQAFVIKKWCTLCLIVQAVIVVNFGLLLASTSFQLTNISVPAILTLASVFGVVVGAWLSLRNRFFNPNTSAGELKYLKFVRNNQIFNAFLKTAPTHYFTPLPYDISLGNRDASTKIIMVSNPKCGPCAHAHEEFVHMLKYYGEHVEFIVRFIPHYYQPSSEVNTIIRHLMALRHSEHIEQALTDWYASKRYAEWSVKYPVKDLVEKNALADYHNWVNQNGIESTPTIFVNGRKLPFPYLPEHLGYQLKNIIEQEEAALSVVEG